MARFNPAHNVPSEKLRANALVERIREALADPAIKGTHAAMVLQRALSDSYETPRSNGMEVRG